MAGAKARDIKRRIKSVKNIEKITAAMKMVAAARLQKAQRRAESARPYADKMRAVMASLGSSAGQIEHPLLRVQEERNVAFVVMGADRGLAGSYNANVMRKAIHEIGDRSPESVKLIVTGRKAIGFLRKLPYEIVATLQSVSMDVTFADIKNVTTTLRMLFETERVDAVYLVYAKFVSALRQEPTVVKLLPVASPDDGGNGTHDFFFEPPAPELLSALLPRYVDTIVYHALLESNASEQGARMTSMSAATKNAGEMIENLTLQYNKARQAAITSEIVEIVSGAEALR